MEKGRQYEIYVRNLLQTQNKQAFLWEEVPENLLIRYGSNNQLNHIQVESR